MPSSGRNRAYPQSVRIIAGTWRGRRLQVPRGSDVRPTPDRVRETLFNWLSPHVEGARCLDLYAGTGALGLEALSRGAREAVLVEHDRVLVGALESNARMLGANARIVAAKAERFVDRPMGSFDIIFLDPPYTVSLEPIIASLPALLGMPAARALNLGAMANPRAMDFFIDFAGRVQDEIAG